MSARHRANRRRSAGPALVALLVGAIAAGSASLSFGAAAGLGPQGDTPASALGAIARGSVLHAPPVMADPLTTPSATPPPPPPPTTTTPPPPPPPPPTTTTRAPRPSSTTRPASSDTAMELRVVELVNAERAAGGCQPLIVDDRLANAAQGHSTDMATRDYFSHESPEGETFVDRALAAGYPSPAAENIARGQTSPEQVMNDWMNSSGHARNILDCEYRAIGVGLDTRGWYWTQVFGR